MLEILEREDLVARAAEMGRVLRARLATLEEHPHVAEVRGLGLLLGIELVRDCETLERFAPSERVAQRVVAAGLQRGVYYYPAGSGPAQDVIMLGPPFTITEQEIDMLVSTLHESIDAAVSRVEQR